MVTLPKKVISFLNHLYKGGRDLHYREHYTHWLVYEKKGEGDILLTLNGGRTSAGISKVTIY